MALTFTFWLDNLLDSRNVIWDFPKEHNVDSIRHGEVLDPGD